MIRKSPLPTAGMGGALDRAFPARNLRARADPGTQPYGVFVEPYYQEVRLPFDERRKTISQPISWPSLSSLPR
jgi:hypothetical protein